MTRVRPQAYFPHSKLIRTLSDLALLEPTEPGVAFAHKLGLWVNYSDAIALSSALKPVAGAFGASGKRPESSPGAAFAASEQLARLRTRLADSITQRAGTNAGVPMEWPVADFELPVKVSVAYEPYRRYVLAQQREMDSSIGPLRASVRALLARTSPALKQVAELDAAFDKVLCERETKLLAALPLLLKKRFEHRLKEHQHTLLETRQADDSAGWMTPGGWLARFCNELQAVLLAELDLRLQPTVGLIEALQNEKKRHS